MAKRVFFSFHYDDVKTFRANVVRNHDLTKNDRDEAGFFDASIWETAKRYGDESIKKLVNSGLDGTSVTCVLIGSHTWSRRWVRYEILKSYDRGNKLFGVHINSVPDKSRQSFPQGPNPFLHLGFYISKDGQTITYYERDSGDWRVSQDLPSQRTGYDPQYRDKGYTLADWVPVYDWTSGDGYRNFASWVENAK